MPRLSVWMVRASLAHFAVGFSLGALMLFNKGVPLHPALWRWLGAHIEMLLIGWTMQLAMGVAYWIAPRFRGGRGRGNVAVPGAAFILLNAGVLMVGAASWAGGLPWVAFAGRVAELLAAAGFAAHLWPRIRPAVT